MEGIANTLIQTICTERNHMPSPLYDVWKSLEPLTTTLLYFLPIIFDLLIQVYLFEGSLYLGTPSSFCIKFDVEWRSHRRILPCFLPSIDRATLYLLKHLPGLRTHRITPARDCYVVVALARNCSSTAISNVFFRKIDSSGSGGGKPLKLKNRTFWINEEVKNEALKVGYLLENRDATCRQSLLGRRGKLFIFYRNAGCKPQDVDKILLDLQDDESVYGGLKEVHGYVNLKHQPELNTSQSIPTCGHSVIVTIARNFGSTTTSNVFCRKIDSSGSGEGKPFQLQKLKDRPFWENEEVTKEGLKVGCLLEYRVVTYHELGLGIQELFIFCRKVSCKPQDLNKILLDLQDDESLYGGLEEELKYYKRKGVFEMLLDHQGYESGYRQLSEVLEYWNSEDVDKILLDLRNEELVFRRLLEPRLSYNIKDVDKILLDLLNEENVYRTLIEARLVYSIKFYRLQAYFACTRMFFIGIMTGTINNERVTLETISGEWLDMPLNCRESLVLSTGPVPLQLKRPWDVADDDVGGVAVVKYEAGEATCEGLILRYKPLVISRDEEPVEIQNAFDKVIPVPGKFRVLFDTGNEAATGISRELLLELNLQPDPNKQGKANLAGGGSGQFETVQIVLLIRGYQFSVCALVDVPAKGTDLLVGMDIIEKLFDLGYTIGD